MTPKKKITFVIRSPFIDRIPSLKNLILFLGEKGNIVKVITPVSAKFPEFETNNKNVKIYTVRERSKKIEVPTSLKLMSRVIRDIIMDHSDLYIACDYQSCKLMMLLSKSFGLKYWNFLLEYPDIANRDELDTLISAEKIITHDKWHAEFLTKNCGTNEGQYLLLPNSTFTKMPEKKTDWLSNRMGLNRGQKILLHSGGLGKWFQCRELAEASSQLSDDYIVVFHTSHNTRGSEYFKEVVKVVENNNLPVKFSLNPVSNEDLDNLVGSAFIGLAFYSVLDLGYKAENMGLAAGKIGNYLKCGVPVIATKLPSLQYIEDYKCGVLIDSFEDLSIAVETINKNYEQYEANARKCYLELWEPTKYLEIIAISINNR